MIHNASRSFHLPALLATALLAGCSNQPSCGDSHPYVANRERPPLAAPAGVSVPAPDPAYVVPALVAGAAGGEAGNCMIRPPDVLGPLGGATGGKGPAPTITRHRHGQVVQETPSQATPAPASANHAPAASTVAAPAVATRPPME